MNGVRANCTLEVPFTHQVEYRIGTTSTLVGIFAHFQAVVSMGSILPSFGVSFSICVYFGHYPARKAAALDPIDAVRHE